MDFTEAAIITTAALTTPAGFFLGLRVCGEKLNTTWTERHPVSIAQDVRAGRIKMRHLGAGTRQLVSRELEALNTDRPALAAVPLTNEGVAGRFGHLSAAQLEALSYDRTPLYRRRTAPAAPALPDEVIDGEWIEGSDVA